MKKLSYKYTIVVCYIGYIVQAIVCNFAPLLFVTISKDYNISLSKLTVLITVTFIVQILVDLLSAKYVDRIGYRKCLVLSHIMSCIGFVMLGILPQILNPFIGIMISVVFYSIGSGLLEVIISPIVESCPTSNKKGSMSFLHSFYCWGSAFVIIATTAFFYIFGRESWRILSIIWAILPLLNGIFACFVPIFSPAHKEDKAPVKKYATSKVFIILALMMATAGASELSMSQWASTFAETGLNVSKTVGDLAGPCMFSILMGIARVVYSLVSKKISLKKYMIVCGIICIVSYFVASFSNLAFVSLISCAVCGFSVGVMWPGTISIASKRLPSAGTPLFAFLALAGDLGCTIGPTTVGIVSDYVGGVRYGVLFGSVFAVMFVILVLMLKSSGKPTDKA